MKTKKNMNIKQIIEAWIIAGNPTDVQQTLAEERGKICDACEFKKIYLENIKIGIMCGKCKCPLSKKLFTNAFNPCPLDKWEKVDEMYFKEPKKKKTLL